MDDHKVEGMISGIICLFLIWFQIPLIFFFPAGLLFYTLGLFFAFKTKQLLIRSWEFGVLFISSGFFNILVYSPAYENLLHSLYSPFSILNVLVILLLFSPLALSLATILIGMLLIFPKMKKTVILGAVLNIGWGFIIFLPVFTYVLASFPRLVPFTLFDIIVGPISILGGILMLTKIYKIGGMLAILSGILATRFLPFLFAFPLLIGGILGITAKKPETSV